MSLFDKLEHDVDDGVDGVRRVVDTVNPLASPITDLTADALKTQAHFAGTVMDTAGTIAKDGLDTSARELRDATTAVTNAGGDVVKGDLDAGKDYLHGYQKAANDLAHGNLLGAGGDVIVGDLKSAGDLAEGAIKATGSLVKGAVGVAGDAIDGAEQIAHDGLTGLKHALLGGGDDKADVMKHVGSDDPALRALRAGAVDSGRKELSAAQRAIAQRGSSAFASADPILEAGAGGLAFFDSFLPAYNAWTGSRVDVDQLRTRYNAEDGMRFDALVADEHLMTQTAQKIDSITGQQQSSYNGLVPEWQGSAAAQFEATMKTYFTGAGEVQTGYGNAAKSIDTVTVALEKMVYAKANAVLSMYVEVLEPGIDGTQALKTMVSVATDQGCGDEQRRWVLGMFHQQMHGRHAWDADTDMWSTDCLDDGSRAHAAEVAANWLNQVLVPTVSQYLNSFDTICTTTTDNIDKLFTQLATDLTSVADPFAGMSAKAPTDDTTTPQSAGGGNTGGGMGGGGTGGGGAGSSGGGGAGGGYTAPTVTTPTVTAPAVTTPTVGGHSTIKTDTDGSVTFGPSGDLTVSKENADGSIDITETDATGVHTYHVVFGPNGRPVVTETTATGTTAAGPTVSGSADTSSSSHGIVGNSDGSVTVGADHSLTVGTDSGHGFTLTQTTDGHAHAYHVSYGADGTPHVSAVGAAHHATSTHDGAGGAAGSSETAATGSDGMSAQLDSGDRFGAQAESAQNATSSGAGTMAPAAASGSGHSGFVGGMPPAGGMARGGAGGEEVKRRYATMVDNVLDDGELEEWDRLGPTIG